MIVINDHTIEFDLVVTAMISDPSGIEVGLIQHHIDSCAVTGVRFETDEADEGMMNFPAPSKIDFNSENYHKVFRIIAKPAIEWVMRQGKD